jgi:hypothetical protein
MTTLNMSKPDRDSNRVRSELSLDFCRWNILLYIKDREMDRRTDDSCAKELINYYYVILFCARILLGAELVQLV